MVHGLNKGRKVFGVRTYIPLFFITPAGRLEDLSFKLHVIWKYVWRVVASVQIMKEVELMARWAREEEVNDGDAVYMS